MAEIKDVKDTNLTVERFGRKKFKSKDLKGNHSVMFGKHETTKGRMAALAPLPINGSRKQM